MSSFIQPVRPIDTAPPWNWNPGATFVEAYNASKLSQQKAEEMRLSNELEAILLPVKQKQAALALDKMQFEVELQSARLDQERLATKQAYRSLKDSVSGISGASNGGAVQDPNAPTIGRWSAARYVGQPAQTTTPAASPKPKPKWSVVKPAATSTGP